jgi:peptidoglycan/LPS O-acetylase OafA/YrhL
MAAGGEKRHFVFLDGMRGIAALAVGWLHASQTFSLALHPDHASLAVDFFFVLSGFVVAYAYDDRVAGGLTFTGFMEKRLIRLYPMIFMGVLLGSLVTIASVITSHGDLNAALGCSLAAFFLIPLGLFFSQQAFPVNGPIWSLFFEIAANAAYGLNKRRGRRNQTVLMLALLASLIPLAIVIHRYGGIQFVGFARWESFLFGFTRVCYPFLVGIAIYRFGLFKIRLKHIDLVLAPLLAAVFFLPLFQQTWTYDLAAIAVLFPVIVALGANDPKSPWMIRFWTFLGRLSYPFYLVHLPILTIVRALSQTSVLSGVPANACAFAGMVIAAAFAYLALLTYDQPVRRGLAARAGRLAALDR